MDWAAFFPEGVAPVQGATKTDSVELLGEGREVLVVGSFSEAG
jgi:hypothetical protein